MNNITPQFEQFFLPQKALVFYQSMGNDNDTYIEAYDMDKDGLPINAHPLSVNESSALAESLAASKELNCGFLQCKGLLPENVLHINNSLRGFAIWHTPQQRVSLFFKPSLTIPCGNANVPAMIWKADKDNLYVYAIKTNKRPDMQTALYHAPFFNIYEDGKVCMGTIDTAIAGNSALTDFIQSWEDYFWKSYFSHLIGGFNPVRANIVQLWQELVNGNKKFPNDVLKRNEKTLKSLMQ